MAKTTNKENRSPKVFGSQGKKGMGGKTRKRFFLAQTSKQLMFSLKDFSYSRAKVSGN